MFNFSWLILFLLVLTIILLIIGIVVLYHVWDNFDKRQFGMIWIYGALGLQLLAIVLLILNIYDKPPTCQLPYSGRLAQMKE